MSTLLALVLGAAATISCVDNNLTEPAAPRPDFLVESVYLCGVDRDANVCTDGPTVTASPAWWHAGGDGINLIPQVETITFAFSKPGYGPVQVASSSLTWITLYCNGTPPTVTVIGDRGSVSKTMDYQDGFGGSSCSSDTPSIAHFTLTEIPYTGAISSITISAPSPLEWVGPPPAYDPQYAYVSYHLAFYTKPQCAGEDSLLANLVAYDSTGSAPTLRNELENVLQESIAAQLELGGRVVLDLATGLVRVERLTADSATICWAATKPEPDPTRFRLLARYHAHAPEENTIFSCRPANRSISEPFKADYKRWGGGSMPDWQNTDQISQNLGHPVPTYVIDRKRISRLDPGVDSLLWRKNGNRWPRITDPSSNPPCEWR